MPQMLSADYSRATEKTVWGLSLKTIQIAPIYMKHLVGVGGVQNCQAGRYRSVLFPAPPKGGVRREASNSPSASSDPEAGDVRPGRRYAENQPWHGLPRCVPHSRYPAGAGAASEGLRRAQVECHTTISAASCGSVEPEWTF
jgi:hypothetical protein